jgi:hypothetical protein
LATPKTSINIHPKVFTGMLVGLAVAVVGGIAGAIDPSMFSALGVWAAPVFSLVTTGLAVLGAWLKRVNASESPTVGTATVKVALTPADPAPAPGPVAAPVLPADPPVPSGPIQVQLVGSDVSHTLATTSPSVGTQSTVIQ